jgi:uncharacterized DUF497 family protein
VTTVNYGDFEWDETKAAENERKHKVTFAEATTVFSDPNAIDAPDLVEPQRFVIIGMCQFARVLFVVFAEKDVARIRIISARKASPSQRRKYYEESP